MCSSVRLFCVLSLLLLPAYSQDSRNAASELSGRVVNEATGEPVSRALVELNGNGVKMRRANAPASPEFPPVFTDASGIFHFSNVPAGMYSATATKPLFQTRAEFIEVGNAPKNIQISLIRLSAVAGKVIDADGNPIRGVNIVMYRLQILDGRRSISPFRSITTGDLGEYRLWNIAPGNYLLKAAGRGSGTGLYTTDALPSFSAAETFAPIFFGGSKDWHAATPIVMRSGSEISADFRLFLQPAHRIRGNVTGMTLFRNATFELFDSQDNQVSSRAVLSGSGGSFQLLDVLAGSYTVRVKQGEGSAQVFGEAQVTVGDLDTEGVNIPLRPGVELKVVAACKNEEAPETRMGCAAALNLYQHGGRPIIMDIGNVNRDEGATRYLNVPVGSYEIQPIAFGRYVTEVLSGGRVVRPNEKFGITEAMAPIEIQTAGDGGVIELKPEFPTSEKVEDIVFLAVPMFETYSGPSLMARGVTQFLKFAPGDYQIYAFHTADFQDLEYRNPEVMRMLPPAATVRVESNGHHQVTVRSISK